MFITAMKTAATVAVQSGFAALTPILGMPQESTTDLIPLQVGIEYPDEVDKLPYILVQFRPEITQWYGLYTDIPGGVADNYTITKQCYFEGFLDFQVIAKTSQERDRLWDSLYNLILMNPESPAARVFSNSIMNSSLIAVTINYGTVQPLGDTISQGAPWSPDDLLYESTVRIRAIGEFFANQYNQPVGTLTDIEVTGTYQATPTLQEQIVINEP